MIAEMTPSSNFLLVITRKGIERNCCCMHRPLKHKPETICHYSAIRLKNPKQAKLPIIRTCVRSCLKDQIRMQQRDSRADANAEGTERRVVELTSKWFIETQQPLMVTGGLLPTWFLGFISRKNAEEILREKELGCFLVRLSDKAIGYILSYKGRDRCRHFVINQSESGQFVVSGDTAGHNSVPDLVDHYKKSPIEPFGEYLTSSCVETLNEEVYDTIQVSPKLSPLAADRTVKNMQPQQQITLTSEQQLGRLPKSNRTQELEVPPLPRRSRHIEPGPLDHVLYAQHKKQSPRQKHRAHTSQDTSPGAGRAEQWTATAGNMGRCSPVSEPHSVYSEPDLNKRSRSLLLLDGSSDGEHSHRLSTSPDSPPKLSPKPVRQLTSCVSQLERTKLSSRANSSHSLNHMDDSAVYQLAGRPSSPHSTSVDTRSPGPGEDTDSVYAEILCQAPTDCPPDDSTYETIPGTKEPVNLQPNSQHHKPLGETKRKHNHLTWGLKNDKWKWLFPEVKRK